MQQTHKPTTTQLKLSQIIQLILQFLQQNNLPQTYKTLQQESQVCLNIIDRHYLQSLIMGSKWELLFKELNYIMLSQETMFDLYQLILDDLIDRDAFQAAYFVFKQCLAGKFADYRERILRIEYICEHTDQKAMYHKPPTQHRKQNLINRILKQTHQQVQRSRLLTLITSALKLEATKGVIMPNLSYSILQGKCNTIQTQMEQLITKTDKILRYSEDTRVTCISMSNKGEYIALGGIDGLIQIYQPLQYTLDTNSLKYQAQGIMLYHDNSIEQMIFNQTDELLATTDSKSIIKIWNMQSGRLLRKIDYNTSIGCCCWGIDSSQFLIGYQNVQMYGIRGCNLLKEYLCGSGSGDEYLKQLVISTSDMHGGRLFVFGQLATIRSFNYKTQQQINILHLNKKSEEYGDLVKVISKHTKQHSLIFHLCLSKYVLTLNEKLEQLSKYQVNGSGDRIELVNIAYSGLYIYECVKKEDGKYVLQARDSTTLRIMHAKEIESLVSIMDVHSRRNLLVMYGVGNVLSFWRP